jgi:hypothetical protein
VFVALALVPALNASVATIFHEHVPQRIQGRVFGLRFAIGRALDPLGAILGGLVVARLADPAMADDGRAASTIGRVIGTGEGRGAALVLLGVAIAMAALAVWLRRSPACAALDSSAVVEESDMDPDAHASSSPVAVSAV